MNKKDDTDLKDFLSDAHLRETPCKIPEGYFNEMEDAIHARIRAEEVTAGNVEGEKEVPTWKRMLRPSLGLACSFLLIFAFAYGIFALTGTLKKKDAPASASVSYEEEEFVNSDKGLVRIVNIADYEQYVSENPSEANDSLSEEDIVNYLTDGHYPVYVLADME